MRGMGEEIGRLQNELNARDAEIEQLRATLATTQASLKEEKRGRKTEFERFTKDGKQLRAEFKRLEEHASICERDLATNGSLFSTELQHEENERHTDAKAHAQEMDDLGLRRRHASGQHDALRAVAAARAATRFARAATQRQQAGHRRRAAPCDWPRCRRRDTR